LTAKSGGTERAPQVKRTDDQKLAEEITRRFHAQAFYFLLLHSILFLSSTTKNRNNRTNFLFFSVRCSQETDHLLKHQEEEGDSSS
jgi:hypothetical protein